MKLFFAVLLASLPALAGDVRTIGGKKVDLQPIHDWKAAKAKTPGERPLKHWKDLEVLEYVRSFGHPVVVVKLEGGATNSIMLQNCPPSLLANLIRHQLLVQKAKSAKADVASAKADTLRKSDASTAASRAARGADFDSPLGIAETLASYALRDAWDYRDRAERSEAAIKEELEAVKLEIASACKLLAMATGRTYATFPIFDTGLPAR